MLQVDARDVTKMLKKGNWFKDRFYPYKFLHCKDLQFGSGLLEACDALFRGRTSYGNFLFELVEHDNNHVIREMTYKEVAAMRFFQESRMCGELGSSHGCVFGEYNIFEVRQCGIWHPTIQYTLGYLAVF